MSDDPNAWFENGDKFKRYNDLKKDVMPYIYSLYPPIDAPNNGGFSYYQHKYRVFGNSAKSTKSVVELAEDLECLQYMIPVLTTEEYKSEIDRIIGQTSPTRNRPELFRKLTELRKELVRTLYRIVVEDAM